MNPIYKWIFIGIAGLFSSCSGEEPDPLTERERALAISLETAYKANDSNLLVDFFDEWAQSVAPHPEEFIESPVDQSIYDIYKAFYAPDQPLYLGKLEQLHLPDDSLAFIVIQNQIKYLLRPDSELETSPPLNFKASTLTNFKPALEHLGQERILYLTHEYQNAVNGFLGLEYQKAGTSEVIPSSLPLEEIKMRGQFLNQYIHIFDRHSSGNWILETHPEVFMIFLNEELTRAIVFFSYGYEDGKMVLEKTEGAWTIKSSEVTGIE